MNKGMMYERPKIGKKRGTGLLAVLFLFTLILSACDFGSVITKSAKNVINERTTANDSDDETSDESLSVTEKSGESVRDDGESTEEETTTLNDETTVSETEDETTTSLPATTTTQLTTTTQTTTTQTTTTQATTTVAPTTVAAVATTHQSGGGLSTEEETTPYGLDSNAALSDYYDKYGVHYAIMYAYKTGDMSVLDAEDLAVYNVVVPAALSIMASTTSTFYRELAAHDWIIKRCTYLSNEYDQTVYGTVVLGTAVCEGYARTFELFMDIFGIENIRVDSLPDNHAWNLVKLSGEWYLVDCTWDDPDEGDTIYYFYFNTTDAEHGHVYTTYNYASNSRTYAYYEYVWAGKCFYDVSDSAVMTYLNAAYASGLTEIPFVIHRTSGDGVNYFYYSVYGMEIFNSETPSTVRGASIGYTYNDYYVFVTVYPTYQ